MSEFGKFDLTAVKNLARSKAAEWTADFAKDPHEDSPKNLQLLLLLEGPMGAGKTQFTRFFIEALGAEDAAEIASPSYAIHHHYATALAPVDHFDLYRVETDEELESIAFWDFFPRSKTPRVVLIEWADRLRDLGVAHQLPKSWRKIAIVFREDSATTRAIRITE